jgi:hypothetical protein
VAFQEPPRLISAEHLKLMDFSPRGGSPLPFFDRYRGRLVSGAFHCVRNCWQGMCLKPQRAGSDGRINASIFPSYCFIDTVMAGLRIGDWRVIFIEDARSITVIAVGNRREIYD